MKSMNKKVKDSAIKTPDVINALIAGEETELIRSESSSLVPDSYYTGKLFPMIESYLPDSMQLTESEQAELAKGVRRKITGLSASIPIKCYGENCPFKRSCPLYKIDQVPEGYDCPIESMVMDLYVKRYIDEFEVSEEDFSEVTTMSMLAATHIMEMRGFMSLGQDSSDNPSPDGLIKNVVGFNNDDEPIIQVQEHPAYNIIERAWKWRTKLMESLGATRKDKIKNSNGEESTGSLASSMSKMKSMIEKFTIEDL